MQIYQFLLFLNELVNVLGPETTLSFEECVIGLLHGRF
jgi:hypothetical protein